MRLCGSICDTGGGARAGGVWPAGTPPMCELYWTYRRCLRNATPMGVESGLVVERPWRGLTLTFCPPRGFRVRADTSDVAFRLLLALGELWDGVQRAGVHPSGRGLHLNKEYLGGYTRIC